MAGNYEPRTNEELQAMDEILWQDKQLITNIVETGAGLDDNDIRVRAIRGYLVGMLLDHEVDDELREELGGMAASFSDGWTGALENAITPTEHERKFLALAIQGLALRQGPLVFGFALSCAKKLGIEEYLTEYLQSWIDYGQKKQKES